MLLVRTLQQKYLHLLNIAVCSQPQSSRNLLTNNRTKFENNFIKIFVEIFAEIHANSSHARRSWMLWADVVAQCQSLFENMLLKKILKQARLLFTARIMYTRYQPRVAHTITSTRNNADLKHYLKPGTIFFQKQVRLLFTARIINLGMAHTITPNN